MAARSNGALLGLPDRFVAVEIESEAPTAFDAAQYSFFGDLSAADSGLEGALEDGLEAPPAEEGITGQDYAAHGTDADNLHVDEEGDLSVAAVFRSQLGLGSVKSPARTPSQRLEADEDAGMDALLTDPLSVARSQLQDADYDHGNMPAELYPDASSSSQAGQQQPQFTPSQAVTSYSLFPGYTEPVGAQYGNTEGSLGCSALTEVPQQPLEAAHGSKPGAALLQALQNPAQPAKALTLEELEARMLSKAVEAAANGTAEAPAVMPPGQVPAQLPQHLQPLRMAMPPGMSPPQFQPPPGGFHPHMMPPHGAMPPGSGPHMPGPVGPILPHMMGPPPPPGSPAAPGMYGPPLGGIVPGGPLPHPLFNNHMGPMPPMHHHMHGMPPPGAMMPPPYGPGGPPGRPMQFGPMGRGGQPQFPPNDGFAMRPGPQGPMGIPPPMGMPGPMHGAPPQRPGAPGFGPAPGQPGAVPPQRPQFAAPPRPPQQAPGSIPQRPAGPLGPGAAALRPAQPRPTATPPESDFGQQFSRGAMGAAADAPVALAAAAGAAGRAGGPGRGPGGRLGGRLMRPEDVEYVVRSMLYTVANGVPYVEDYYYQAFVHKHVSQPSRQQLSPGAFPMAAPFVPEALRELSDDTMHLMRLDPSARVKFVEGLQGLGKIVLSNIRTPKVLMDLSESATSAGGSGPSTAGDGGAGTAKASDEQGRTARPLEQEPLLAARIMIEDCMNLLLDVDDIDRLANHMSAMAAAQQRSAAIAAARPLQGPAAVVAAAGAAAAASAAGTPAVAPYGPSSAVPPAPAQLRQRRELLLAGINGAFRLPTSPAGTPSAGTGSMDIDSDGAHAAGASGELGDSVLLRILALSKGRSVVARALLAINPPPSLAASSAASANAAAPSPQQRAGTQGASADSTSGADAATEGSSAGTAAAAEDLLGPNAPSPYVLLWATLRNAWSLFGSSLQQGMDAAAEKRMLEATARLAAALRDALLRLPTARDVVDAAAAFNAGCTQHVEALGLSDSEAASSMEATLLPLAQTRAAEAAAAVAAAPPVWLGEALAALVTRASQLGLAAAGEVNNGKEQSGSVEPDWAQEFSQLHERVACHLKTLCGIHAMAVASSNAEALAVVRSLSCRLLVHALLPHASEAQALQLKDALAAFAA